MALVLDGDNGIVGVLATNADGDVIIDTNTFFVDAPNDRVGIGTTTPQEKLQVYGNIHVGTGEPADYNHISFERESGADVGAIGWHSDNMFYVAGHPSFGPGAGNTVRVYGFGADLRLGDNANGDVLTVKYTNGNVGIGTTNPGKKLDVNGEARITTGLTITPATSTVYATDSTLSSYATGNGVYLNGHADGWLRLNGSGANRASLDVWGENYAAPFGDSITFRTGGTADRMIVNASGNVIIGDLNTEGYKLEVVSDNAANNLMVHKKNAVGPGLATNIAMQVTQTNGQSARLAEIGADFESGWGGSLHFATKNNNGSPNNSTTERMRIDYDGRVTMPYQPSFCAGVGSNYTLVNFAQKINHSHEFSDIGGHYNNTNNRFTAPVAGNYFFWHRMNFGNAGTGNVEAKIYINGVERFRDYEYAGGSGQYNNSLALGTYYMNAGDYAEPWSHVNNTPQPTLIGSTTIQISTFGGWLNT
jgi:hypothetical protein